MRILVLGGTRFVGRALAARLLAEGHAMTVVSRHPAGAPSGAEVVGGERQAGLASLEGRRFDATVDFICHDAEGPEQVYAALEPGTYVLVSSAWIPRLDATRAPLPDVTRRYLEGKLDAERSVARLRAAGRSATTLRLPIMWGRGDRTGRLEFYRRRLREKRPLIAVNGGGNLAQVSWSDDAARVVDRWLTAGAAGRHPLWEAMPDEGAPVRVIISEIAAAEGVPLRLVEVASDALARELPAFLADEPLWRETAVPISDANLYAATGLTPTPRPTWLMELARLPLNDVNAASLEAERIYMEGRTDSRAT